MNYRNAEEIFPKELLQEIRRFMPEGYVYISASGERRPWGSMSGQRKQLQERNQKICEEYEHGRKVREIAKEQYLSERAVYKILQQVHR